VGIFPLDVPVLGGVAITLVLVTGVWVLPALPGSDVFRPFVQLPNMVVV
jgi:hypothetical protein